MLTIVVDVTAQMPTGREFVVAVPALWRRAELIDPGEIRILVMATRQTDVTLRWSGPDGTILDRVSVQAGGRGIFSTPMLFQTQNLMQTNFDRDSAEANQRSLVVEATEPISVFLLYDHYVEREFNGRSKTEMWSVPPTTAYDTSWVVTVDSGTSAWGDRTGFLVIAAEDGTVISWKPSVRWGYTSPLEPVAGTITLKKHQVYQVLSWERGGEDANLSGTKVSANRPITLLPFTLGTDVIPSRKSTLAEHQYSVNQAGRTFYAVPPTPLRTTRVRLVAQHDGTTLSINDQPSGISLDCGDFHSIEVAGPVKIEASRPVVAMQMLYYPDGEARRRGASSMALLPPVENYREKLQWINPRLEERPEESQNVWHHYAMITVRTSVAASVLLDGEPVLFDILHADGEYVSAVVPLNPKHYVLEADGPLGAIAYGVAIDDAYACIVGEGARAIVAAGIDSIAIRTCDTIADVAIPLESLGNLGFRIDSVVADGIRLAAVRYPPSFPTLMPPGRELEIRLRFSMPTARLYSGTVRIYTNALNESVTTIPFRILRDSARLRVPGSVDFGRIDASQSTVDTTIRIVNDGEDSLRITTLVSTDARFTILEPAELPLVLGPGEVDSIVLRAIPESGVQVEGRIEILGAPCFVPLSIDLRLYRGSGPALERPATIDFTGDLCDSAPGSDTTIILRAVGDEPLLLEQIELGGDNPTMFALLDDPSPTTILPGESATVTIRYAPVGFGLHRATLRIVSNDARRLPPIGLIGRRDTATIVPEQQQITLPRLSSCAPSTTRELRIRNTIGTVPAEITTLAFAGDTPFSVLGPLPGSLAPLGGERIVEIRFAPTTEGDWVDTLLIGGGPCGIEERVVFRGSRRSPALTSDRTSHSFGLLELCRSPSDSTTVRLRNSGEIADTIFGVVQSGDGVFAVRRPDGMAIEFPLVLAAGQEVELSVRFVPGGAGRFRGEVGFEWGPCDRIHRISLEGEATEPSLLLSSERIEFGQVDIGIPGARRSITLANRSSLPRVVDRIDVGADANPFRLIRPLPLPITLPPGREVTIEFEFDPTDTGRAAEIATISIDPPCADTLRIELRGEGRSLDEQEASLTLDLPDHLEEAVGARTVIPLVVSDGERLEATPIDRIEVLVEWAASLLYPEDLTTYLAGWRAEIVETRIEGDRRVLHLRFSGSDGIGRGDTLGQLSALVLLGDRDTTDLLLQLLDLGTPPGAIVTTTLDHGSFALYGICRIDGPRLLASDRLLRLGAPRPNPGSEIIEIPIRVERSGRLEITLYDLDGTPRSRPIDQIVDAGEQLVPIAVSYLPVGIYLCRGEFEGEAQEVVVIVRR